MSHRLPRLAAALLAVSLPPAAAAALPPDLIVTTVATGLGQPVALAEPDDGSGRLFVLDRAGKIRVIAHGSLVAAPYLTLDVPTSSEQGLTGIAFAADFATSGVFYLAFTAPVAEPQQGAQPDQVLARFVAADPAAAVFAGTRTDILRVPDIYANHNGGDIHFGPDGYLWWSMGDGGNGGDPHDFAQNLWRKTVDGHSYRLLGKLLRLDVGGDSVATSETCGAAAGTTLHYRIPADNPFVGVANACDEIVHYGLRNSWRFSFDGATDMLLIGDVGQGAWEEIDRVPAAARGLNFGWSCKEGDADYTPGNCAPGTVLTGPVFQYPHASGRCSVTGGRVYRGPDAALHGVYFYGDYCSNDLDWAEPDTGYWHAGAAGVAGTPLATGIDLGGRPVGFGADLAGRLYVMTYNGRLLRIETDGLFANGFESASAGLD